MLQITGTRGRVVALPSDSFLPKDQSPSKPKSGKRKAPEHRLCSSASRSVLRCRWDFPGTSPSCVRIQALDGPLHGFH